jgi:hypothetical protein
MTNNQAYQDGYAAGYYDSGYKTSGVPKGDRLAAYGRGYADGCEAHEAKTIAENAIRGAMDRRRKLR